MLPLESVLAALEAAGVHIDRAALGAKASDLRKPITIPCGGKLGSTQRARLTRAGREIVHAIAAAVNPDGKGTAEMIAAALMPQPPLEARQRAAADKVAAANIVASYLDAKKRSLSKQEQRQRLSALVPRTGRQGYTRPMLNKEFGLKLTKYEWGCVRLHALAFGNAATAEADAPKPAGLSEVKLKDAIEFIYSPDNMQQVAFGSMDITLSSGETMHVPATMRVHCRQKIYEDYANARRDPQGKVWFGEKGAPGSFRYHGLGRTKFLEAASLAAKGDLKQLGALDGISEFCGRMQFAQLRNIARELATLCPIACGGAMLGAVLKRIDAVEVHIKRDLKAHLSHQDASDCAWHCANHAQAAKAGPSRGRSLCFSCTSACWPATY